MQLDRLMILLSLQRKVSIISLTIMFLLNQDTPLEHINTLACGAERVRVTAK